MRGLLPCLLLVAACAIPPASPSTSPSSSSLEAPGSSPPASIVATATTLLSPSPTLLLPPASASLPVRGSGEEIAGQFQMTPGPEGGLYVLISTERRSVLALLDSSGQPGPGWPIALDDTWCFLPAAADDGSVRLVCGFYGGTIGPAFAFEQDGRLRAGWPVELVGGPSAAEPVVDGGELYVVAVDLVEGVTVQLVAIAADGSFRTGTQAETPPSNQQDRNMELGPDGTGYLLAYPNDPTGDTEITAIDLGGVRPGWLARVKGRPSGLAFGVDGRIYATEADPGDRSSRIVAFGPDGRPLSSGSDAIAVAATSAYQGAGPYDGPPPPAVSDGGTVFLVTEDGGTTVYALDAVGDVNDGWPYRDTIGLQWSHVPLGDVGTPSWRSDPSVGPGNVLYLLHPPRTASVGGSIVAIGPDGRVRPGWPVVLSRPGGHFHAVLTAQTGTVFALAIEPEAGDASSATVLAIASDSTVLWSTTVVDP